MRVRFLGKGSPTTLATGNVYEVVAVEGDFYRIVDDTDEDYLYPKELFEVEVDI